MRLFEIRVTLRKSNNLLTPFKIVLIAVLQDFHGAEKHLKVLIEQQAFEEVLAESDPR